MRKKVLLLLAAALCMAALTTGTLAFFTDEETAHNVITSGGVNIAIVEKQAVPGMDGTTELKDFPENGITGIMPGSAVSKIVSVQNTDASEAWIRVKVDAAITSAPTENQPNGISLDPSVMSCDIQNDWVKGEDGFTTGLGVVGGFKDGRAVGGAGLACSALFGPAVAGVCECFLAGAGV